MVQKYTDAKKKANKKWDKDNIDRTRYLNARSAARGFIKNRATNEDLQELKSLIKNREEEIK